MCKQIFRRKRGRVMTREDAIKTLKELWRETNDPWYEEVYSMAIDALEADRKTEPSDLKNLHSCMTCKHKDKADNDFPCVRCFYDDTMYEAEDEPQTDCENKTIEEISYECVGLCNIREKRKHCDLIKTKPQTDYSNYERAVEQIQYDMLYESTYNAEDGSM